jgi:dihydrodipicolinate synthase/N-acetylneuraminate lyase
MQISWNGVYPALTTKFTDNDELDLPLFGKNLQAQVAGGVAGVIIGGSLGEASTLTKDEKEILVKFALQEIGDKVPVIVNIAEGATRDAVALAKDAEKWGADGLMLLPPMRYKSDERETIEFFQTVAAATSLPIILYNNPVDYKIEITLDMFDQLKHIENIQAIKESTRDVSNVTRLKNKFGDRYKILCGVDTLTFEELSAGADGLVAGLVCAFPAETVAIFNLIKAEKYTEALKIYRWFMPLLEFDILPKLVQYIKLCEVYTGIGSENVRAPRLPIIGAEREAAIKTIEIALASAPAINKVKALEPAY